MNSYLNRRGFIKTSLAAFSASYFASFSINAKQLESYWRQFQQSRHPSQRPIINTGKRLDVRDFGAKGDGKTKDTKAIQAAIDEVVKSEQPGTVCLSAGVYLSGSLRLGSQVNLQIDKQAMLLGSTDIQDYEDAQGNILALLAGDHCESVSISGEGTIDGQGRQLALNINRLHHAGKRVEADFNERRNRSRHRPNVVALHHCQKIKIYDVTIKNGASWVQHYAACQDVMIDNIVVDSDAFWNNDGIDINDCRNVRITGCFVNAADDAICLKSTTGGEFHNDKVYIGNCVMRSSSNGIKFGTESMHGFTNVTIENIRVFDTYRSAIALETVDGAKLENVHIDGVEASNVGCAIFIRLGQRNRDVPQNTPLGTLKNVVIKNLKAEISASRADEDYEVRGPGLNTFFNPIPSSITGLPDAAVENIRLENIDITYPGRANKGLAYRPYDQLFLVPQERDAYPEYTMFGELPAWGLYIRHAKNVELINITLRANEADFRPAFVFDDVTGLMLKQSEIHAQNDKHLILHDVKGLSVEGVLALDTNKQLAPVKQDAWHQSAS
ncbi:MAG: glycosyl hydrolase family 28 protein [Paraglaciecola sp.]|nr:glycosyl hydrolase family 28 protein [Paraglaciecola sp.]